MNRASSATGWVRNPVMKSPELDPTQASSYELGWTFNPLTGCLNGCPYCYARKLAYGRLKPLYLANPNISPIQTESPGYFTSKPVDSLDPFYPRFWPERLDELDSTKKMKHFTVGGASKVQNKGIFVCDMSDLFGIGIPEEWTREVLNIIRMNMGHRFYLLTKQPQNLIKFSPFPDNCWVGVTATNAKMAEEAGFWLWEVKARVKFISFEPLLEQIPAHFSDYISEDVEGIKWVIIGAQTKPYKPPQRVWVDEITEACKRAGIPYFLKNNLEPIIENRKLIQEMPR